MGVSTHRCELSAHRAPGKWAASRGEMRWWQLSRRVAGGVSRPLEARQGGAGTRAGMEPGASSRSMFKDPGNMYTLGPPRGSSSRLRAWPPQPRSPQRRFSQEVLCPVADWVLGLCVATFRNRNSFITLCASMSYATIARSWRDSLAKGPLRVL